MQIARNGHWNACKGIKSLRLLVQRSMSRRNVRKNWIQGMS